MKLISVSNSNRTFHSLTGQRQLTELLFLFNICFACFADKKKSCYICKDKRCYFGEGIGHKSMEKNLEYCKSDKNVQENNRKFKCIENFYFVLARLINNYVIMGGSKLAIIDNIIFWFQILVVQTIKYSYVS